MLVVDGKIKFSSGEFQEFARLTWAPWVPRTPDEFNAMVNLAIARCEAEDEDGMAILRVIELETIRFGEDGKAHFPVDQRRMEYAKVHGTWATDEELADFETNGAPRTSLTLVR